MHGGVLRTVTHQVIEQDDGYPHVKVLLENPPEALREKVLKAARYCPNNVITVLEE